MIKIIEELGVVIYKECSIQKYNCVIVECEICGSYNKVKKTRIKNKEQYICKKCSCGINGKIGLDVIKKRVLADRNNPSLMNERKARLDITRRKATAKYRKKNQTKIADYHYLKHYNITKADAIELKTKGCFICGSTHRSVIDHDHLTGKIRGVLCDNHNKGLGLLGDTYDDVLLVLEKLKEYLKQ